MSFSVDQFMQVKCKFQMTSESESSESIHTNSEQIRLCTSAELDGGNSSLIILVCSNEISNNHILAYYIERRQDHSSDRVLCVGDKVEHDDGLLCSRQININHTTSIDNQKGIEKNAVSSAKQVDGRATWLCDRIFYRQLSDETPTGGSSPPDFAVTRRGSKPKIIVKQIYYHSYNEDVVALCLSASGTRLILINASSTIYILPIKNILLNLHAQQLRSSQGRSMYFYDASIISCMRHIDQPISIAYWESKVCPDRSYIIVACREPSNRLVHISVEDKTEICSTSVGEPIKSIEIIEDKFSYSLLITCKSLNQYRQTLELVSDKELTFGVTSSSTANGTASGKSHQVASIISLPKSSASLRVHSRLETIDDELVFSELECTPTWSSKPIPIRLQTSNTGTAATSAFSRVLTPVSRFGSQANMLVSDTRERPISQIMAQTSNYLGVIDVLGSQSQLQPGRSKNHPRANGRVGNNHSGGLIDTRLLRFYSNKQYFYRPQRPQIVCKLNSLDSNEQITHLVLTDRFIAFTTDRDRCIINSRNCCRLKGSSLQAQIDLDPLVKEVTFNNEEKIMTLIKSPVIYDQDNILDSFILVTTRSIYAIDARHSCRDLFINLIDSHLAIKRTLFTPRHMDSGPTKYDYISKHVAGSCSSSNMAIDIHLEQPSDSCSELHHIRLRSAESNLLINDFLQHKDVYEKICHDSLAFSTLFKLELISLYEAYGDRLLQRGQFELANRFFQMANFDHTKILGKYVRIGAYKETIEYVKNILNDECDFRGILAESERIELAKIAFECLLAKLIVERSKLLVYKTKLKYNRLARSNEPNNPSQGELYMPQMKRVSSGSSPGLMVLSNASRSPRGVGLTLNRAGMYKLCGHSPKNQEAKLSTTTIVGEQHDDEETLTSNTDVDESSNRRLTEIKSSRRGSRHADSKLECEKAFIDFVKNFMPSSMYEYAIDRILDFDLIELAEHIIQSDAQIITLVKALVTNREEDRIIFRTGRLELLSDLLERLGANELRKVEVSKPGFLEFITSPRVTRALVGDISLTCEYYGYQHTLVQFRKYSFAALKHLEAFRRLVDLQSARQRRNSIGKERVEVLRDPSDRILFTTDSSLEINDLDGEQANDGSSFKALVSPTEMTNQARENDTKFDEQQRWNVHNIFVEFLTACMDESREDSCRLWFNYVNFYLNYLGGLQDLQADILKLVESSGDCRLAISLYYAIHRDESTIQNSSKTARKIIGGRSKASSHNQHPRNSSHYNEERRLSNSAHTRKNVASSSGLEAMRELHNLTDLFENEFLMKLLGSTLELLPQAADLDAILIATMC